MISLLLSIPAFALTESEVEAAVNVSSKEAVTGNLLVWFLCAVAFLKISQKIDSFMASLGVNVGHTGGSMLAEAMIAFRGVTMAAGGMGRVFGGHRSGGASFGTSSASGASGWFLKGGLAGVVNRKMTSDAVKTATSTKEQAVSTAAISHSEKAAVSSHQRTSEQHSASIRTSGVARQSAVLRPGRSTPAAGSSHTTMRTRDRFSQKAIAAGRCSIQRTSLGGKTFTNSMLIGGGFANDVIGMVATGDIRSTGSITGDFAAQALSSYTGITALGESTPSVTYSNVEIGGGRITGTEHSAEHPEGISFTYYHTSQYAAPEGDYKKIFTADGAEWYKQYAVDTVSKHPFKAPDGEIDYQKEIVKRLPDPPKRKDRM